ncbi:MAG: extracellular solute-binding protein [Alphaproteobacteria bacterium]|nr:extracellular solute-binding protein [Alphaproteobacteria bacterium]
MSIFTRLCALLLAFAAVTSAARAADEPPALAAAGLADKAALRTLIDAAVKEGQVSYWDTIFQPETNDALTTEFKKQYGLPGSFKVGYTLSATGGLVTRVDQELAAGKATIDVASVASLPWIYSHVRDGKILQYDSPQYAHFSKAFGEGLGKKGYFAFVGAYVFVPMWNTENLDFKGTSWIDVLGAVPEKRLSIGDATKSETYRATYLVLRRLLGKEYFEKLAKMSPNIVLRSENVAERLVSGEDLMADGGMPTRAYQFNERGAKLKFIIPKEGAVLLPEATFILSDAPHPNAAKLWVDFVLSEAGQKIIVEHEALISGRDGFKSPLPDYAPAIDSIHAIPVDWEKVTLDDMQKARDEWAGLFMR